MTVDTPTNQELAAYAEKAAEIVEQGWCQGKLEDENGRCCALGAIGKAVHSDSWFWDHYGSDNSANGILASKAAELIYQTRYTVDEGTAVPEHYIVVYYNNDPERTQAEIVDLFKSVAKEFANQF